MHVLSLHSSSEALYGLSMKGTRLTRSALRIGFSVDYVMPCKNTLWFAVLCNALLCYTAMALQLFFTVLDNMISDYFKFCCVMSCCHSMLC